MIMAHINQSLTKEHARYLGAMFITVLTSQATMVVDAAVGGNLLGADAVSAVDLVMPVYEVFYSLVMMLGLGGCTVASMCLGRGDVTAVRRHFTAAVTSSLVVMVLLGAGILLFKEGVVRMLCGDSYLCGLTCDYLLAMVPYFILAGLSIIFMLFTSMAGRPVLMMCGAIVQFCINLLCNLLLIKVANLGIEALAYSSALSCIATMLILLPYYLSKECPFRMIRCGFGEFAKVLGDNIRYGVGFMIVEMAYTVMAYSMNSLVLEHSGEQALFFWSVVLMIYQVGSYASASAEDTSLLLGGRLFGAGRNKEARMVYNRSLLFALGWILLILAAIFVSPRLALPLFGAADAQVYPPLQRVIAWSAPIVVGMLLGNMLLIRFVQHGKVVLYMVFSCLMYLAVPLGYYLFK